MSKHRPKRRAFAEIELKRLAGVLRPEVVDEVTDPSRTEDRPSVSGLVSGVPGPALRPSRPALLDKAPTDPTKCPAQVLGRHRPTRSTTLGKIADPLQGTLGLLRLCGASLLAHVNYQGVVVRALTYDDKSLTTSVTKRGPRDKSAFPSLTRFEQSTSRGRVCACT